MSTVDGFRGQLCHFGTGEHIFQTGVPPQSPTFVMLSEATIKRSVQVQKSDFVKKLRFLTICEEKEDGMDQPSPQGEAGEILIRFYSLHY